MREERGQILALQCSLVVGAQFKTEFALVVSFVGDVLCAVWEPMFGTAVPCAAGGSSDPRPELGFVGCRVTIKEEPAPSGGSPRPGLRNSIPCGLSRGRRGAGRLVVIGVPVADPSCSPPLLPFVPS